MISGGREPFQAWSRDKGQYQQVTGQDISVAPVGPYAVVRVDEYPQLTLIDLRGRQPRPLSVPDSHSGPQWSPDGTRIPFTVLDKNTAKSPDTIVDAGSGQQKSVPVDTSKYFCTDYCTFTWSRDGTEVAWPLTDEAVTRTELEAHARKGIQMFSADDGRPTRMLPVRGEASGPFAWSPDGPLGGGDRPGPGGG